MSSSVLKKSVTAFWVIDQLYKPCLTVTPGGFIWNVGKEALQNLGFWFCEGSEKPHQAMEAPGARGVSGAFCVSGQGSATTSQPAHEPALTQGRAQHPPGCLAWQRNAQWAGVWRVHSSSTNHFNALMTKAWTPNRWIFPLSFLAGSFRWLQEQFEDLWESFLSNFVLSGFQSLQKWAETSLELGSCGTYPISAVLPGNSFFGPFGKNNVCINPGWRSKTSSSLFT